MLIILNNYNELAYIECAKEKGFYPNLKTSFDDSIKDEDMVSINPKYKTNFFYSMEKALEALKLNKVIVSDREIEKKSLELIIE